MLEYLLFLYDLIKGYESIILPMKTSHQIHLMWQNNFM